jgi:hypothetical protein
MRHYFHTRTAALLAQMAADFRAHPVREIACYLAALALLVVSPWLLTAAYHLGETIAQVVGPPVGESCPDDPTSRPW